MAGLEVLGAIAAATQLLTMITNRYKNFTAYEKQAEQFRQYLLSIRYVLDDVSEQLQQQQRRQLGTIRPIERLKIPLNLLLNAIQNGETALEKCCTKQNKIRHTFLCQEEPIHDIEKAEFDIQKALHLITAAGILLHNGTNHDPTDHQSLSQGKYAADVNENRNSTKISRSYGGADELHKGRRYYKDQDYVEAAEWFLKSAHRGNQKGQFYLGYCYNSGEGVKQDYAKAVEWYTKSANQGHAIAQYNLALKYENGQGVPQDLAMAVEWYTKSANQGHTIAQFNLASKYENGQGVMQDHTKAMEWYTKSANQGDADAQYTLGLKYENGQGVKQDYAKAVEWYTKSAHQGDADSQCNLGVMYENGHGVVQDYTKAVEWYTLSAHQGQALAQYNLGLKYENGQGITQDDVKAMEWYTKSANQGHVRAQYRLRLKCDNSQAVTKDREMHVDATFDVQLDY